MGIGPDFPLIMYQVNISESLELISLFNWCLENIFIIKIYNDKMYELKNIQINCNEYSINSCILCYFTYVYKPNW